MWSSVNCVLNFLLGRGGAVAVGTDRSLQRTSVKRRPSPPGASKVLPEELPRRERFRGGAARRLLRGLGRERAAVEARRGLDDAHDAAKRESQAPLTAHRDSSRGQGESCVYICT